MMSTATISALAKAKRWYHRWWWYGAVMVKRTVYLPNELDHAVKREAAWRGTSEAEVIREAIRRLAGESHPAKLGGPLFNDDLLMADRVDDLLAQGFGTA